MEMTAADPRYREVADIANDLYKAGIKEPKVATVRQVLIEKCAGTGRKAQSPAWVRSALILWTATERPVDAKHSVPELPHSVAVEMHRTIQAAELRVHELLEPRLQAVNAELKDAADSCLEYESQNEELAASVTRVTRERDILTGQLHEQTALNAQHASALDCERKQSADLRLQLARAQIGVEVATRHASEAKERECALRNEIAQARTELLAERTSRAEAERRSDIASVRLESEVQARTAAEASVSKLLVAVGSIESSSNRAMAAEILVKELRAHVATLNVLLTAATTSRSTTQDSKLTVPLTMPAGTHGTRINDDAASSDANAAGRSLRPTPERDRTELVHHCGGDSEQRPDRVDDDQPGTDGSG